MIQRGFFKKNNQDAAKCCFQIVPFAANHAERSHNQPERSDDHPEGSEPAGSPGWVLTTQSCTMKPIRRDLNASQRGANQLIALVGYKVL